MNNDRFKFRVRWKCQFCHTIHMSIFEFDPFDEQTWDCKKGECEFHNGSYILSKEQCTGWRDYGEINPVYEGDICQHPDGTMFVVKWEQGYSGFRASYLDGLSASLGMQLGERGQAIVISNIHENPELLKNNAKK